MKLTIAVLVLTCVWSTSASYVVDLEKPPAGQIPKVYAKKILNLYDDRKFTDCEDVFRSGDYVDDGVYMVHINVSSQPIQVECRYDGETGTSYTAILIQKYGHVSFHRGYADYVHGFGSASAGDFWMGLLYIKHLTDGGSRVLTLTLQDWAHTIKTLQYRQFRLGEASQRYPLFLAGYISSRVLPDDLSHNNGKPFSTPDLPDANDCAPKMGAGWWFNYCTFALPTGRYYQGGHYTPSGSMYDGIFYKDWLGFGYSLKYIRLEVSRL